MWCRHCLREVQASSSGLSPAACPLCGRSVEAVTRQTQAVRQAREILERWQSSDLFDRIHNTEPTPPKKQQAVLNPPRLSMQREEPSPVVTSLPVTPVNRPLPPLSELASAPPASPTARTTSEAVDLPAISRKDLSSRQPTPQPSPSGPASASVVREVPTLPVDLIDPPFLVAAAANSTIADSRTIDVTCDSSGAIKTRNAVAGPVADSLASPKSGPVAAALTDTNTKAAVIRVSKSVPIPLDLSSADPEIPQTPQVLETRSPARDTHRNEPVSSMNDGINTDSIAAFFENNGANLMQPAESPKGALAASKPRFSPIAPMLFPPVAADEQIHSPDGNFPGQPDTENMIPIAPRHGFVIPGNPTRPIAADEKIRGTTEKTSNAGPRLDPESLPIAEQPRGRTPLTRPNLQRKSLLPTSPKVRSTTDGSVGTNLRIDSPAETGKSGIDQPRGTASTSVITEGGRPVRVSNSPDVGPHNRMATSPTGEASQTPSEGQTMASRPTQQRFVDAPHSLSSRGPHFDVNPPRRTNLTSIIGQTLAYIGVLGLTVGTSMVIYGHFGGYAEYTPTGWLVTTVAQMLLFLGVINLVSGGMEQNNEDVSRRIQSLGDQLLRIEQATSQSPHSPQTDDLAANGYPETAEYSESNRQVSNVLRG
jgi:hypothetical protein